MWSPFSPFWFLKYLNFGQKLPIRTAHYTFSRKKNPWFTKHPYYILPPEWSKKKVSANGLKLKQNVNYARKI